MYFKIWKESYKMENRKNSKGSYN